MELIKFYALLKSTLWGGEKIVPFKHLSTEQHNVGENWEISGVPDNETVVANGVYVGKKLNDIVAILNLLLLCIGCQLHHALHHGVEAQDKHPVQ